MEKIKIEDILGYHYLSGIEVTDDGVFFVVAKAKADKTGYDRNLYTLRGEEARALTSDGKFGSFDIKSGKVFFAAKRSEEEKKVTIGTTIYALPLDGGEAAPYMTVKENLGQFSYLDDKTFLATVCTDMRLDGIKEEEKEKKAKELADYEDIEEAPFYFNGQGYVAGHRSRLALIKDGKVDLIFSDNFNTESFTLSQDGTRAFVVGTARKSPKFSLYSEVRELDIATKTWKTLVPAEKMQVYGAWCVGDKVLAIGSEMDHHGCNQNPDFYLLEDGEVKLLKRWGEAIGSTVGTDVRLGGGAQIVADGDWLYFTTTLDHSSYIYRINEEGIIESVIGSEGSVDSFGVKDGRLLFIGMRGQKLQEIYDADEKQVTKLNEKVLKNKYVAVPEELKFQNDGVDFTGWVIKPYGYVEGKKYPAIFDIHGGPKTVYGTIFMHEMQLWASEGYFVFWTNPRGADGRGDDFADIRGKYGTIDYEDLMAFTDAVLKAYPDIDADRLGETGGSYGGFMSNWILGHTDRFKAIATQRSIYNWISFWGTSDISPFFAEDQCAADMDNIEGLFHRSPMEAIVKNAKTPTLIIHSDKDYRCPVEQAYQLFNALVARGVPTKMALFHNETHELSRSGKPTNRLKRLSEITTWMNRYLK